jgi:6-phosphogluconate dehydrogenase
MTGAADIGVVGLGVMGQNLALNVVDHGFGVAVWNRHAGATEAFVTAHGSPRLRPARTLAELVAALASPRRVLLMITPGPPVDATLEELAPLLAPGDVIVDGGNSWWKDTRRRETALAGRGIRWLGCGVSGGEEGARRGPSLMPGGTAEAYAALHPILEAIAARTPSGPCVAHLGPDGAGHFVKMVHNGIEYGVMQLIAEAYDVLRRGLGLDAEAAAGVFGRWNRGPLESFLVELAARVLRVRDEETGRPLVDLVEDAAAQKGTGRWTVESALELGVPVPTIAAALDARVLSSLKAERSAVAGRLGATRPTRVAGGVRAWTASLRDALHASMICAYAQGMTLIAAASLAEGWRVDLAEVARVWTGGCIIRARLLDAIRAAYRRRADLPSLLLDPPLAARLRRAAPRWRGVVAGAARAGIPLAATVASLAWVDAYRSARLPQSLVQAQRDAFGAHTYRRLDHPERGALHSSWVPAPPERRARGRRG